MPTGSEFSRVDFRPQDSNYQTHDEERSDKFSPNSTIPDAPPVPKDVYPNLGGRYSGGANPFSSDVEADPKLLHEETRAGVEAHASMNESYGLCQPVATPLRDDLTSQGNTLEPGNAAPEPDFKIPLDKDVLNQ